MSVRLRNIHTLIREAHSEHDIHNNNRHNNKINAEDDGEKNSFIPCGSPPSFIFTHTCIYVFVGEVSKPASVPSNVFIVLSLK